MMDGETKGLHVFNLTVCGRYTMVFLSGFTRSRPPLVVACLLQNMLSVGTAVA